MCTLGDLGLAALEGFSEVLLRGFFGGCLKKKCVVGRLWLERELPRQLGMFLGGPLLGWKVWICHVDMICHEKENNQGR